MGGIRGVSTVLGVFWGCHAIHLIQAIHQIHPNLSNSSNCQKFLLVAKSCQNFPKLCVTCVRLKCISSSSQVSVPPHQTYRCRANSGKPSIGNCNESMDNRVFVLKSTNIQIIVDIWITKSLQKELGFSLQQK